MKHLSLLLLSLPLAACQVDMDSRRPATPQRPFLASTPDTASKGTVELQVGVAVDPGEFTSVPGAVRYGLTDRREVFVGLAPYLTLDRPDRDVDGAGDVVLGYRERLGRASFGSTLAYQVSLKLPTADEDDGLGTGEFDGMLAGILQHPVGERFDLNAFYEFGLIGDPGGGADVQHSLSAMALHHVADRTDLFLELAKVFTPDERDPSFATLGALHRISPELVLDAGMHVGLDADAPDAMFVLGLTTSIGRVKRRRATRRLPTEETAASDQSVAWLR